MVNYTFKALSTLCFQIFGMSLLTKKDGLALCKERELEPVNRINLLCSQTGLKLFNKLSTLREISHNHSNIILFKCRLMLLLPAKSTISPTYMSFNNLFAASTFSLCESPHGIILEYLINTSQVNVLLVFREPCFVKSPIERLEGEGDCFC